jgi:hypothetical protein
MTKNQSVNYFANIIQRYSEATKEEKTRILNEYENNSGLNRKYIIRLFKKGPSVKARQNPGRKRKYYDPKLLKIIEYIWKSTNLLCSKRLKAVLQEWIPSYEKHYGVIPQEIKELLGSISDRTIDRLFYERRKKYAKKGLCTTRPGTWIKSRIPIKTNQWDEKKPGFFEADTIAHCGDSIVDTFIYTFNLVDINTQWSIQRALWGKGSTGVLNALKNIERALPFDFLGFDCDNGSEFMNYSLFRYFKNKKKFQFTRSREYQKNDNAHIESKNWSIIRQYLGYQRFDDYRILNLMNDLYSNEFYLLINFFIPSFKLKQKIRVGSKIVKIHDKPKTPFQRVIESEFIPKKTKIHLKRLRASLDPITLKIAVGEKISNILKLAKPFNYSNQSSG